jgi:peptidyl-prolyl cis-trans isomerase A (cyclophilin A)
VGLCPVTKEESVKRYYTLGLIVCLATVFAISGLAYAQTEGGESEAKAPQPEAAKKVEKTEKESNPLVVFDTTKGKITIELYSDKAPVTVKNFLTYVNEGFYNGTVFHRVIPRFVVQGGGMTADMERKATHAPIVNEADNGLKNLRGTLSMARTNDPNSATSQFFINLVDNAALDKSESSAGYAVFGKVIRGMDIVDRIAGVETTTKGQYRDVPAQPITITKAYVVTGEEEASPEKAAEAKTPAPAEKKAKEQKATDN